MSVTLLNPLHYGLTPAKIFRRAATLFAAGLIFCVAANMAAAEAPILCIEEDWVLDLNDPNPSTTAPQVTTVFSPAGDLTSLYAAFELNQRTLPEFTAGGMQLQLWNDGLPLAIKNAVETNRLQTPGETVTWTQRMLLQNGQLVMEVVDGNSETWGTFGDTGNLRFSMASSLESLSNYDPEVSVSGSGVSFAGNRVVSLRLDAVRWFSATGLEQQQTTPSIVFPQP